jgi:hypothetical protein
MDDKMFKGTLDALTKEALLPQIARGVGMVGRGAIWGARKAPGTAIGAAFAIPGGYSAAKGMTSAFGKPIKLPKRTNLLKPRFPQGVPGKMIGGF